MSTAEAHLLGKPTPWSDVKGFNYQPSYGTNGQDLWQRFDADQIAIELDRGVKHFPHVNALRWWQSSAAFDRDRDGYARNFERTLQLASERGLAVMPVLFNRWHCPTTDYGGIYLDHFVPGVAWSFDGKQMQNQERLCAEFVERIVGEHADDERIFSWDLCNEPFIYGDPEALPAGIREAELAWLTRIGDAVRAQGARAPICVGIHPLDRGPGLREVEPLSDVLAIHPYFDNDEGLLDEYQEIAAECGKSLIATEVCWGSFDDAVRAEIVRTSLGELSRRGIGWLAYVMHHSLIVDAHRPEHGPVNERTGTLHFIEPDGSLRPGHEVFNEF